MAPGDAGAERALQPSVGLDMLQRQGGRVSESPSRPVTAASRVSGPARFSIFISRSTMGIICLSVREILCVILCQSTIRTFQRTRLHFGLSIPVFLSLVSP